MSNDLPNLAVIPRSNDFFYMIDFPDGSHEALRLSWCGSWVIDCTNQGPGMYADEFVSQHPKAVWRMIETHKRKESEHE